uniref:NUDIX hydrolase n=1 Tax=uncultured Prochlorococcus sp. TaxID=159733 RepID=UPI00258D5100
MGNKKLIKRSIFKEKISELKSKKFSFEINRIELPNGHEGEYGYIKHPGAALAVPITKNNKVIVLRQYRFAVSRYLLEFPAGTLEIGETPINSIKREIQEETGFSAKKWDELGTLVP